MAYVTYTGPSLLLKNLIENLRINIFNEINAIRYILINKSLTLS